MPGPENKRETAIAMRRVLKDMPIPKDIVVATPEELIRRKDAFWHVIGLAQKEGQVVYRVGGDGV